VNTRSAKSKGLYKQATTPEDYLLPRLNKTEGCWLWIKGVDKNGYGQCQASFVARKYKVTRAHQLAYVAWNGAIPKGRIVCHTCDNPTCCNPSHLYAGTWKSNVRDCLDRGRYRNGAVVRIPVEEIYSLQGIVNCFGAGLLVGTSYSTVCSVWRDEYW
jgi:hypothetical protein